MKVPEPVIKYINFELHKVEVSFKIKILFWALRSSYNTGIYRKNSDIDIYFVFSASNNTVNILHHMDDHTFDFWGCSVNAVKESIRINTDYYEQLYDKKYFIPQYINKSYQRASCNYMYSLYFLIDNEYLYDPNRNMENAFKRQLKEFNKSTYIATVSYRLDNDIQMMIYQMKNSVNDYLRIFWRILYIYYIKNGGCLGKYNINYLLSVCDKYQINSIVKYLEWYRCFADEKNSFLIKDVHLEKYIQEMYAEVWTQPIICVF